MNGVAAYPFKGNLYVNLTNRCPTACRFCIKNRTRFSFHGANLALSRESTVSDVLAAAGDIRDYREAVFCGFGEPTMRLANLLSTAAVLRSLGVLTRLNTVGLGSLVNGRDIVPELARVFDAVSVSLNTADPAQWAELHKPQRRWRPRGFSAVIRFIANCAAAGIQTTVTAIQSPDVDLKAVEALARSLGARFRLRPPLGEEDA